MKVLPYGEKSVLVELGFSAASALATVQKAFPDAEILLGLESIVLKFKEHGDYVQKVTESFPKLVQEDATSGELRVIPIEYNGEDLEAVAKIIEISTAELIQLHQETVWRVGLIGFAPGFPYLLPTSNQEIYSAIPRLDSPRTKVPAKAVALAAGMCCIYPSSSPGGWQLIGTTNVELFNPERQEPSLLKTGDLVRFELQR